MVPNYGTYNFNDVSLYSGPTAEKIDKRKANINVRYLSRAFPNFLDVQ